VQIQIFRKFLFQDFLIEFRRIFRIRKYQFNPFAAFKKDKSQSAFPERETSVETSPNWHRFREYPFFDWNNQNYETFMIQILRSLEVRSFKRREIILEELQEVTEILFVQTGRYDIGYEINKVLKFRLQFGPRSIIGGFNLVF